MKLAEINGACSCVYCFVRFEYFIVVVLRVFFPMRKSADNPLRHSNTPMACSHSHCIILLNSRLQTPLTATSYKPGHRSRKGSKSVHPMLRNRLHCSKLTDSIELYRVFFNG